MANETVNEHIVRIKADSVAAVKQVVEYTKKLDEARAAEKQLRAETNNMSEATEEQKQQLAAIQAAQTEYKRGIQECNKEIQNNIKASQEQDGSLRSLRAELSNLTKEYDSLSRAEREGAKGQELQDKINATTNELKKAEEETQRYYRNVGNYKNSIVDAFQKSGGAVGQMINPIKNVTNGFKVMSTTPVIAILGLLANVINKVIEGLHSSEGSMKSVQAALAPLKAGTTLLTNVFQKLAEGVAWVAEKLTAFADKLGLISDAMKEEQRLTKEELALTDARRNALMQDAEAELNIAKLKEKATDKINYSHAQRLEFLKQATDAEDQLAQRRVELARREYQLLLDRSKLAENSAEENQKLAEAYAAMINAEKDYFNKKKELNAQITEATNQQREQAKKAAETELKEINAANQAKIELMKDGAAKELAAENANHETKIAQLQQRLKTEKNLTAAARDAINRQIELENQRHNQRVAKLDETAIAEQLQRENELIQLRLAAVKAGSDAEYQLQLESLNKQREIELNNAELTGEQRVAIEAKYDAEIAALRQSHHNELLTKAADELRLEWENKINEATLNHENTLALEVEFRRAELDSLHQMEEETDAQFKARMLAAQQAYNDAKQQLADYEVQIEQTKLQAMSDIAGGLSSILDAVGEDNVAFANLSKVVTLAQIGIDTGRAIAAGTASASAMPYPANIAAIASTVATVLANIATAIKTVKGIKFAEGGYVSGAGTGTSDSIAARLSNGESVNNANSTAMFAPLYSALNQIGGGVPIVAQQSAAQIAGEDMLARAVARGVASLNMRVGVDEIQRVSSRVKVVETLGDI